MEEKNIYGYVRCSSTDQNEDRQIPIGRSANYIIYMTSIMMCCCQKMKFYTKNALANSAVGSSDCLSN